MSDSHCQAQIFSDPKMQEEFDRQGFVVQRILAPNYAKALLEKMTLLLSHSDFNTSIEKGSANSLYSSVFSCDPAFKQTVDRDVTEALAEQAEALLPGYRILFASLLAKPARGRAVALHADWTMQTDLEWPTVTLWCALSDVTPKNGPLEFVAGSHGLFGDIRRVAGQPVYEAALSDLASQTTSVPIGAGEAVLFDTSILHQSAANETDIPRLVMGMTLIPKHRDGVLHFSQAGTEPEQLMLRMDRDEYLAHSGEDFSTNLQTGQRLGLSHPAQKPLTRSQVLSVVAHSDQIKAGERTMADVLISSASTERAARPIDRSRYSPAPLRKVLRDPRMQAELEERGHTAHQLISAEEAAEILSEIEASRVYDQAAETEKNETAGEYLVTSLDSDSHLKRLVHELAMSRLKERAEALFQNYRVLSAWPFLKQPGGSAVPFHRDWSMQSDNDWPTINVWCPLMDVDSSNGVMQFVEASHRLFDQITIPSRPEAVLAGDDRMAPYKVDRPTAAGEAIIFDPSMYHGSAPNISDRMRIAIALTCIPKDRPSMIHELCRDVPGMVDTIAMDTDDFISNEGMDLIDGTASGRHHSRYPLPEGRYSIEEVFSLVKHADAIKSGSVSPKEAIMMETEQPALSTPEASPKARSLYRRIRGKAGRILRSIGREAKEVLRQPALPTAGSDELPVRAKQSRPTPAPHNGRDFAEYPFTTNQWRPFGQEQYDAELQSNGYTSLPFLAVSEVDELAAILNAAEHELDRDDVHIGTRFQLSAFNNDSQYKERVFDATWAFLKDKVEALVPGYQPLVINVFDKPPSNVYDPVPIHQNPSFVEEPVHRSISLWIPFTSVNRENGTVGVMPGSHGRFNAMRAGNMAHEDVFAEVQSDLEDKWFKPVEMQKGEALALDDSIIHWSYPNNSNERRKAVQLIMVPGEARHIYYFYDDDDADEPMMDLYEVDKTFFFGFNCKARPETLKKIGRVPYHYRQISRGELEEIARAG